MNWQWFTEIQGQFSLIQNKSQAVSVPLRKGARPPHHRQHAISWPSTAGGPYLPHLYSRPKDEKEVDIRSDPVPTSRTHCIILLFSQRNMADSQPSGPTWPAAGRNAVYTWEEKEQQDETAVSTVGRELEYFPVFKRLKVSFQKLKCLRTFKLILNSQSLEARIRQILYENARFSYILESILVAFCL